MKKEFDKINKSLDSIVLVQQEQAVVLKEHISRTKLAEKAIDDVRWNVDTMKSSRQRELAFWALAITLSVPVITKFILPLITG